MSGPMIALPRALVRTSFALALCCGALAITALAAEGAEQPTGQAASSGSAQGDSSALDDLFSGGTSDTTAPAAAVAASSSALSALKATQPLTFSGSLYCMAAGAAGYSSVPPLSDLSSGLGLAPGVSLTNYIYFDARPDSDTRYHLAIGMSYPGFSLSIYELWFDYFMADRLFFRGGQQVIGWGNGRIFSVGDLMSNSSTALSLKTYFPFGANGLTVVTMVQDPSSTETSNLSVLKPEIAPRLDLVFGSFEFSEAATVEYSSSAQWASIVKTSQFEVDLYGEVFGTWLPGTSPVVSSFESAFWQAPGQKFSLYAEHYYDGSSAFENDNRVVLLPSFKAGGFTYGVQWTHAFTDNSGQVMPAMTFSPYNHLTITFGLPCSYGVDGSIYAGKEPTDFNSPVYNPQNLTNPNQASPITTWNGQRYSVFLKIALSFNY
jgi:hypothetical protein